MTGEGVEECFLLVVRDGLWCQLLSERGSRLFCLD